MPYEDDIRDDESMTSTVVWTVSLATLAVAAVMIWFVATH